jgi:hypothetical protein
MLFGSWLEPCEGSDGGITPHDTCRASVSWKIYKSDKLPHFWLGDQVKKGYSNTPQYFFPRQLNMMRAMHINKIKCIGQKATNGYFGSMAVLGAISKFMRCQKRRNSFI